MSIDLDDARGSSRRGRKLLLAAGIASAAISVLHLGIVFAGAPAYRYFGAGEEMARKAEAGSLAPAALTLLIAAVFAVFAAYAFSGAGLLRRLPLLRVGLVTIAWIYLLRGFPAFVQGASLVTDPGSVQVRDFVFSLVSLLVGLAYAFGLQRAWRELSAGRKSGPASLALLVSSALLAGCTASVPAGEPAIRGVITHVDRPAGAAAPVAVLIEEDPATGSGSDKARVRLTKDTKVFRAEGEARREASAADLREGQRASAWFAGPVGESYPVQATASALLIEP